LHFPKCILLTVVVFSTLIKVRAQPPGAPDHLREEGSLRRFVRDYLAAGAPISKPIWPGTPEVVVQPGDVFGYILARHEWVQEATIEEIIRLSALPNPPAPQLLQLAAALAHTGSVRAFEAIQQHLRAHPKYVPLVKGCLVGSNQARVGAPFGALYLGLQSDVLFIRDFARERVQEMARFAGATEQFQHEWANGLLARYGRPPTDAEILADPVAEEVRLANPGLSLSIIPRARELAREAAEGARPAKP